MNEAVSRNKPITLNEIDATIAKLKIAGKSNRAIGKIIGKSKDAVANRLTKDNVKALIEYGSKREAMRIPAACDVMDGLLCSDDEGIRLKAAEGTFKNTSITPSHTQNIYIDAIYQDNRQQIIAPEVLTLLGKHLNDGIKDKSLLEIEKKGNNIIDIEAKVE